MAHGSFSFIVPIKCMVLISASLLRMIFSKLLHMKQEAGASCSSLAHFKPPQPATHPAARDHMYTLSHLLGESLLWRVPGVS